jgi:hypothetical protein
MGALITVLVVFAVARPVLLAMSLRNVQQYEKGWPTPADSYSGGSRAHS